jgi:antitoxin VapB
MTRQTAKILTIGASQAVRLPADYRVDTPEVLVERIGQSLLITPEHQGGWDAFFSRPSAVPDDFLAQREIQHPQFRDDQS